MKYYLYVSDAKIDMLYSQIAPTIAERIAGELSINLGFIGASLKEKPTQETRYSKLQVVLAYLDKHVPNDIGTIENPKTFIQGTCEMRWGPVVTNVVREPIVCFVGKYGEVTIGLGGSTRHVVGAGPATQATLWPGSNLAAISLIFTQDTEEFENAYRVGDLTPLRYSALDLPKTMTQLPPPEQKLEFFAKTLFRWPPADRDKKILVLLATPLYVALAE